MNDRTRAILVTGGAGYIGSHCCKALSQEGFLPVTLDNLSTGHLEFVRWGPLVVADIRDGAALSAAMSQHRPIAVLHLAALALVGPSVGDPGPYWDVNVGGTRVLLDAMRRAGVGTIVASSTCAVYGQPDVLPIGEDQAKHPVNPYGASKLAAEGMMDDYSHAYGISSVRLRYFNAAGATPSGEIGEDHDPETHLIPLVLDAACGRRGHVDVFGSDYPTEDGTAVRDYVHVEDLASAHVKALEYLLHGGRTRAFNLGTGHGASVAGVIREAEAIVGGPIPCRMVPRRAGDPACLVASSRAARSVLGWRPERSGLRGILADAWSWHCSRFDASYAPRKSQAPVQGPLVASGQHAGA
jgi:UDP-glucose-4-epimerase GalE